MPLMKRVMFSISLRIIVRVSPQGQFTTNPIMVWNLGAITYAWKAIHSSTVRDHAPQPPSVPSGTNHPATTLQIKLNISARAHRSQRGLNTHLAPAAGNGGSWQRTPHQPSSWSLLYTSHSSTVTKDLSHK